MELKTDSKKEKSFTLIELLVVVAVIGILAGITLSALGGARNRGKDTRIITNMNQIRVQAKFIFLEYGFYARVNCNLGGDPNVKVLCNDIASQGGRNPETGTFGLFPAYSPPFTAYCVKVQLNSGKFWCIDSEGRSAQYDNNPVCASNPGPYTCE